MYVTAIMAGNKQIILSIFLLTLCKNALGVEADTKEELVQSETKDGKLEIIKRIKKVNDDGSYTIGYEADDGSFKIESRDVLGNIKGTYGFLDEGGQIKRVSYSTSNSSEVLSKPEPQISVVQRIPKFNKTSSSTTSTKRTSVNFSTTQPTPTSTNNVIQSIARRRNVLASSTTTSRPNYSEIINIKTQAKTTSKPNHVIYSSAAPRVLLQGRSSSTVAPFRQNLQKLEGQLVRPEVINPRPTELPLFALKHPLLDDASKPVSEDEPQVRSNILRRQLAQEKSPEYDLQEHVFTLQQSLGDDSVDVYSGSETTGSPRPLFTTTSRPRSGLSSTTQAPIVISRPTIRYQSNYQRNVLQDEESSTPEYVQESSSTTESELRNTTPTPIPVVQIPANRPTPEPLVAIRHPFQRGAILVPLSQLQGRILPVDNIRDVNDAQEQYGGEPQQQYIRGTTQKPDAAVEPRPIIVRRLPPPPLRPIPVQVDENGYIREMPQHAPTPYPLPIPITPVPKYLSRNNNNNNINNNNEVDEIEPPVSTREFQQLLQQLILRQTRLERISALAQARRNDPRDPRFRSVYQPYFVQKNPNRQGPVQFVANPEQQHHQQRQFVAVQPHHHQQPTFQRQKLQQDVYDSADYANEQTYAPTRRVARLLPSMTQRNVADAEGDEQYLPPPVREMLLLRMLQLAINPALPVEEGEEPEATTAVPHYQRVPVRNVEILGEEVDQPKRGARNKRFRELVDEDLEYYD